MRLRARDSSLKPARSQSDLLVRSASDNRKSDANFLQTAATQKRRKVLTLYYPDRYATIQYPAKR